VLQTARIIITGPLPVLDVVPCALTLEDLELINYSPCLLLPASLPSVIVNDAEYVQGCKDGFDFYGEYPEVYEAPNLSVLKTYIMQELFPGPSDTASLAVRVGCVHGFLSMLAFTDRAFALAGLDILIYLVDHLVFLSRGRL